MTEQEIGVVKHFFDKISVAVIEVKSGDLKVGDTIHIKGHTTDVLSKIDSMQVEHQKIDVAKPGDAIGTKVSGKAREQDKVFKVTEP